MTSKIPTPSEVGDSDAAVHVQPVDVRYRDIAALSAKTGVTEAKLNEIIKMGEAGRLIEQKGVVFISTGRVIMTEEVVDEAIAVAMSMAEQEEDPQIKLQAIQAINALANTRLRAAELMEKLVRSNMLGKGEESRKGKHTRGFGPGESVRPPGVLVAINSHGPTDVSVSDQKP